LIAYSLKVSVCHVAGCYQTFSLVESYQTKLPDLQSAYRAHHSTETAVLKIVSDILRAADSGKVTLLSLIDTSAAFHSILIDRLNTLFGALVVTLWTCYGAL